MQMNENMHSSLGYCMLHATPHLECLQQCLGVLKWNAVISIWVTVFLGVYLKARVHSGEDLNYGK